LGTNNTLLMVGEIPNLIGWLVGILTLKKKKEKKVE
jgi:hypothetical protein